MTKAQHQLSLRPNPPQAVKLIGRVIIHSTEWFVFPCPPCSVFLGRVVVYSVEFFFLFLSCSSCVHNSVVLSFARPGNSISSCSFCSVIYMQTPNTKTHKMHPNPSSKLHPKVSEIPNKKMQNELINLLSICILTLSYMLYHRVAPAHAQAPICWC